jgi:hypothetical protein
MISNQFGVNHADVNDLTKLAKLYAPYLHLIIFLNRHDISRLMLLDAEVRSCQRKSA